MLLLQRSPSLFKAKNKKKVCTSDGVRLHSGLFFDYIFKQDWKRVSDLNREFKYYSLNSIKSIINRKQSSKLLIPNFMNLKNDEKLWTCYCIIFSQVQTCLNVMQSIFSIVCITFIKVETFVNMMQFIFEVSVKAATALRWGPCGGGPAAGALRRRPWNDVLGLEQVQTCSNAIWLDFSESSWRDKGL